jgi:hypothetical protein
MGVVPLLLKPNVVSVLFPVGRLVRTGSCENATWLVAGGDVGNVAGGFDPPPLPLLCTTYVVVTFLV